MLSNTKNKSFGITIPEELNQKIEEIREKFEWSKSKVIREIIDKFVFLHNFMMEYMAYEKKPPEIILTIIKEIEEMINVLNR